MPVGIGVGLCLMLAAPSPAPAEIEAEEQFQVLRLPEKPGGHWVWVGDPILKRSALFDGDDETMLTMVNGGLRGGGVVPHHAKERGEVYVSEIVYSRGHRGERTDVLTIYDAATMLVDGEVVVPGKGAEASHGMHLGAVLDGERFFAGFNQTPATSVSIINLETRTFAGEIDTPGCVQVFPAGVSRFGMLCGDGKVLLITLDDAGEEIARVGSSRFFDAVTNPVFDKAARRGNSWFFSTYEGYLHEVDFSGDTPQPRDPWSLLTEGQRSDGWRVGGVQFLAIHEASGRLYCLVHKGGPGSHKDPGEEIWVYDLAEKRRVSTIVPSNTMIAFIAEAAGGAARMGAGGPPVSGFWRTVAGWVIENPGAHYIAVTQDAEPLLFVGNMDTGAVGVHDAMTGERLRDIRGTGLAGGRLVVP